MPLPATHMEEYAKLLTSISALVGAVIWPAAFLGAILIFRREMSSVLNSIPSMLNRMKKASLAGVAVSLIVLPMLNLRAQPIKAEI